MSHDVTDWVTHSARFRLCGNLYGTAMQYLSCFRYRESWLIARVQVKISTHKIDLSNVTSKCGSKDNIQHTPRGGEKKVPAVTFSWHDCVCVVTWNGTPCSSDSLALREQNSCKCQGSLTLYSPHKNRRATDHHIDRYTGRWWVGCYIWYSEEGTGRVRSPPRPLLAVPNVTAHPSTASVPISYYSIWYYNCLWSLKS